MAEVTQNQEIQLSVLIVDSDKTVRKSLSLQLKDRGWNVYATGDYQRALKTFQLRPTTVALIDIGQDDRHGVELAKVLKDLSPNLITIIMTGYPSLNRALEALREGIYDYLVKPFRLEQLTIVIERAQWELSLATENWELKQIVAGLQQELDDLKRAGEIEEGQAEPGQKTLAGTRIGGAAGTGSRAIASYAQQMGTPLGGPHRTPAPPEEPAVSKDQEEDQEKAEGPEQTPTEEPPAPEEDET